MKIEKDATERGFWAVFWNWSLSTADGRAQKKLKGGDEKERKNQIPEGENGEGG